MKKYLIFTGSLTLFISIFSSACSKNEPFVTEPNPRDGVYEGEKLTVIIDGEPATSIKSISVSSIKIPYAQSIPMEDNGSTGGNGLDVYDTSLIFNGFPGTMEEITLKAVSTIYNFSGIFQQTSIDNSIQFYEFLGTFTGDPDSPHSAQGLILEFTTIENSL